MKRFLSLMLAILMVVSMVPTLIFSVSTPRSTVYSSQRNKTKHLKAPSLKIFNKPHHHK